MKKFTCYKCGKYTTNRKANLIRHLNRKISCTQMTEITQKLNPIEPQMTEITQKMNPIEPQMTQNIQKVNPTEPLLKKYECKHCHKTFSTNSHMHRHQRLHCKENRRIVELERKLQEMEERIVRMSGNHVTHHTTNNHMTTNINNFHINSYGRENIDHLQSFLTQIMTHIPLEAIPALIEKKYFDSNHPENHTVKIKNKKEKWIYIYKNGGWELNLKKNIIHNMIDTSFQDLNDHYAEEKMEYSLPKHRVEQWGHVRDSFHDGSMYKNHEQETERIILNEQKKKA